MNPSAENPQSRLQLFYAVSRGLAGVALVTAIITSVIILLTYERVTTADPLNSHVYSMLRDDLKQSPQDELLKKEIRTIHLLSRKAFFTSVWQLRTGGFIILVALVLFFIAMKIQRSVRRKLPDPAAFPLIPDFISSTNSIQISILTAGGLLFTAALVLAFLKPDYLQVPGEMPAEYYQEDTLEADQVWLNFRGPGGNGIAVVSSAPELWDGSSAENILWKSEVPLQGFSSPVVVGDQVFITGGSIQERKVFCYHSETGVLEWTRPIPNMLPPDTEFDYEYVDPNTGFAASTMASDGEVVIAIVATGDVAAYQLDGDMVWARNLGAPDNHYAHSTSLIIHEDLCYVQYDQHDDPRLLALNVSNGATAWEQKRKVISWASPVCVNTGERMELILADNKEVSSYNPADGTLLWQINCLSGEVGPSPAVSNGLVFVANEYSKGTAIRINTANASEPASILWQYLDNLPNTASPLVFENYILMASSRGILTLLSAETGAVIWTEKLKKGFYASPILVGEKVYLMDLNGKMFIFNLTETFTLIAENELGESSACTPAFTRDRIYLRGEKHLFCIGSKND